MDYLLPLDWQRKSWLLIISVYGFFFFFFNIRNINEVVSLINTNGVFHTQKGEDCIEFYTVV